MPVTIHQFLCLTDNYGYLIRDEDSGKVACIDTPDAEVIMRELKTLNWSLDYVFNTHWHSDHTDGNAAIKNATNAVIYGPEEVKRVAPIDHILSPGDHVHLGQTQFSVIGVPGHTLGHIAFYSQGERIVFVGDSFFTMGCGRMFEGNAHQMWGGLQQLAALPDDTHIYCGHEYTASNSRFAMSVDRSQKVHDRAQKLIDLIAKGKSGVPSTIGEEKATNPFLRAPQLTDAPTGAEAFLKIRQAKDVFKG